jgi:hypothetical protein
MTGLGAAPTDGSQRWRLHLHIRESLLLRLFIQSGSFGVSSDFSLKESPLARILLTLHLYWIAVVEILSVDLDHDRAEAAWPGRPW